jgi:hypothetical protein
MRIAALAVIADIAVIGKPTTETRRHGENTDAAEGGRLQVIPNSVRRFSR